MKTPFLAACTALAFAAGFAVAPLADAGSDRDVVAEYDIDDNDSASIAHRLERAAFILQRVDNRIAAIDSASNPPKVCEYSKGSYNLDACRQIAAVEQIAALSDSAQAHLDRYDAATDEYARWRRLDRAATSMIEARARLSGIIAPELTGIIAPEVAMAIGPVLGIIAPELDGIIAPEQEANEKLWAGIIAPELVNEVADIIAPELTGIIAPERELLSADVEAAIDDAQKSLVLALGMRRALKLVADAEKSY